jgi:polyisoprenoid-binding protein YceI
MAPCYADRRKRAASYEGGTMIGTRIATAALLACVATVVSAQDTRVSVGSESKLWIDGTSNLHAWSCKATTLDAAIDFDAALAAQIATAPPKALKRVQVKVPVKSLKCGHDGMDNNLYKALKADESADISYILATFEAVPGEVKDTFTFHTVGALTIAGSENKVEMDVIASRLPDGSVMAKGLVSIKMTDFGIKPPTAIFGRIKTGNEVKVNFELTIGAKAIAAAAGTDR